MGDERIAGQRFTERWVQVEEAQAVSKGNTIELYKAILSHWEDVKLSKLV